MDVIQRIAKWLLSNPTAVIALISATIALMAYRHQRKGLRKQNACQVAEKYAREMLPRMRYIDKLLEIAGLKKISNKFSDFELFTERELNDMLLKAESTKEKFREGFSNIDEDSLKKAFAYSGCTEYIYRHHKALLDVARDSKDELGQAIIRVIKDFLNDLEAMAILLRYNIADEKLIYQSLHQTFLKYMKHWYFYISDENRNDQDRFYSNIIWLYNIWKKRKNDDEASIDRILWFRTKAKKL